MSAWQRLAAVSLAFALSSACKGRERADLRRVTPLVPGARAPVAEAPDAGRPRASNAQRTHRAVRYIADRPAPDGALGVRWGMTRAAVLEANRASSIECRDSREYVFCRRALTEVPLPIDLPLLDIGMLLPEAGPHPALQQLTTFLLRFAASGQ